MRRATCACLALSFLTLPASADFPCDELWGERNAIYHEAGYCFRTARGIAAFGNAGCRHDDLADVPLTARNRADIAEIQSEERKHACPR